MENYKIKMLAVSALESKMMPCGCVCPPPEKRDILWPHTAEEQKKEREQGPLAPFYSNINPFVSLGPS